MSSPSVPAAVNGDASLVLQQGRPSSSKTNERAAMDGIKAMHVSGERCNASSSTTAAMGIKMSNKHSNAGRITTKAIYCTHTCTHPSFLGRFHRMGNVCRTTNMTKFISVGPQIHVRIILKQK